MLHYKACARTRKQKAADIALMVFGMAAAVYTTVQTVLVRSFVYIIMHHIHFLCFPLFFARATFVRRYLSNHHFAYRFAFFTPHIDININLWLGDVLPSYDVLLI